MKIKTEFKFELPKGLLDENGEYKKTKGVMRLLKVQDVIDFQSDGRVQKNASYYYVAILSRVILSMGDIKVVNAGHIEKLCPEDFVFLVDFFNEINHRIITTVPVECENCNNQYVGEIILPGEL